MLCALASQAHLVGIPAMSPVCNTSVIHLASQSVQVLATKFKTVCRRYRHITTPPTVHHHPDVDHTQAMLVEPDQDTALVASLPNSHPLHNVVRLITPDPMSIDPGSM